MHERVSGRDGERSGMCSACVGRPAGSWGRDFLFSEGKDDDDRGNETKERKRRPGAGNERLGVRDGDERLTADA